MRKLASLSALLLIFCSIAFLAAPADALIPCDCEYCAGSPGGWCLEEWTGIRLRCYQYNELFCSGLSAPAQQDVSAGTEFFPLEFLGLPAADGRLSPLLPIAKPGC